MAFKLPELIVEACIRDGLSNARRDPEVIQDVFADLTVSYNTKKYGVSEIEKLQKIIEEREVSVVHSFHLVPANLPCVSIQLSDNREDESKVGMGNYIRNVTKDFSTPEQLASLIKVTSFQPTSYNALTGVVVVPDAVNLGPVYANLLFVDSDGAEHIILGGIINEVGAKQFIIEEGGTVALGNGATIKTSIDFELYVQRGTTETAQIIIGVHTKEALLTKYLYTLVKYFILSRRNDLIKRGFQITTYNGSDFARNLEYQADVVFTRFLNVVGLMQHEWRSDKVQLIDSVNVAVKVPKDRLGNEALNLTDMTIQVKE